MGEKGLNILRENIDPILKKIIEAKNVEKKLGTSGPQINGVFYDKKDKKEKGFTLFLDSLSTVFRDDGGRLNNKWPKHQSVKLELKYRADGAYRVPQEYSEKEKRLFQLFGAVASWTMRKGNEAEKKLHDYAKSWWEIIPNFHGDVYMAIGYCLKSFLERKEEIEDHDPLEEKKATIVLRKIKSGEELTADELVFGLLQLPINIFVKIVDSIEEKMGDKVLRRIERGEELTADEFLFYCLIRKIPEHLGRLPDDIRKRFESLIPLNKEIRRLAQKKETGGISIENDYVANLHKFAIEAFHKTPKSSIKKIIGASENKSNKSQELEFGNAKEYLEKYPKLQIFHHKVQWGTEKTHYHRLVLTGYELASLVHSHKKNKGIGGDHIKRAVTEVRRFSKERYTIPDCDGEWPMIFFDNFKKTYIRGTLYCVHISPLFFLGLLERGKFQLSKDDYVDGLRESYLRVTGNSSIHKGTLGGIIRCYCYILPNLHHEEWNDGNGRKRPHTLYLSTMEELGIIPNRKTPKDDDPLLEKKKRENHYRRSRQRAERIFKTLEDFIGIRPVGNKYRKFHFLHPSKHHKGFSGLDGVCKWRNPPPPRIS